MQRDKLRALYRQLSTDPITAQALKQNKHLALHVVIWLVLEEGLIVGEVYPIKYLYNGLTEHTLNRSHLMTIVLVMTGLYLAVTLVRRFMDTRRHQFYFSAWSMLWGHGHRVEQRQSVSWHTFHSTGEKQSIMSNNVSKVDNLIDDFLFETLPTAIRLVLTTIGITIFISWRYGVLLLVTLIIYCIVAARSDRQIAVDRVESRTELKAIERFGTELTVNWRTQKYFGMEAARTQANQDILDTYRDHEHDRSARFTWAMAKQSATINMSRLGLWTIIVTTFVPGQSIGAITLAVTWMENVYSNFYRLSSFQRRLNESYEPYKELLDLFLQVPDVTQPANPQWPERPKGGICFQDVNFAYQGSNTLALHQFNLDIAPGETVALVGESGCGKTTVAELIMRSFDPAEGRLSIDGVDLRLMDYDRYRRELVAIVNQSLQLYEGPFAFNIAFARPDAPFADIEAMARLAQTYDFIMQTPQGFASQIGENGNRLSGGQIQRLALARALLCRPRILILDEATSALDAANQDLIKAAVDKYRETVVRCTVLIIAHRLSTVMTADKVVVMRAGQVEACGTHDELLRSNAYYRDQCSREGVGGSLFDTE